MIVKEILTTLQDIAESLRIIAKRESEFPVGFKADKDVKMEVVSSNLQDQAEIQEQGRLERIDKQIEERGEGFFFAEDAVDEELVTGGFV